MILYILLTILIAVSLYLLITSILIKVNIEEKKKNKDKKYTASFGILGAIIGFLFGYSMSGQILESIVFSLGFILIFAPLPVAIEQQRSKSIKKSFLFMSYLFETGLKFNLGIDKILILISESVDNKKQKQIIQTAGALYKQTKDLEETFLYLQEKLKIKELELLKNSIKEYEAFGRGSLVAIETFTKTQNQQKIYDLTKKKESVSYIILFVAIFILFGAIAVYFTPLFKNLIDTLSNTWV